MKSRSVQKRTLTPALLAPLFQLESYPSPSKKALWQCISEATGNVRYYRTQEDLVRAVLYGSSLVTGT